MPKPLILPLAMTQPSSPFNIRYQLNYTNTNPSFQGYSVLRCPAFRVQPGVVVTLRPTNGGKVNTGPCVIADTPQGLFSITAFVLPAAADVAVVWPVDNTGDIWTYGQTGDGLLVTVQQGQIG